MPPDVSAKNAVNVTNEVKPRPAAFDGADGANFGGAQFLDLMMARLTALSSDDAEIKDFVKKADAAVEAPREANFVKNTHGVKKGKQVGSAAEATEKEKIQAKIAEIIASDDTPVLDDRAVKLLKKVAEFLIKAEEQGKIDLPDELAQALQVFLDQPEMKAAHLADFMSEFISLFRQLNVAQQAAKPAAAPAADGVAPVEGAEAEAAEFVWPKEIADAFAELKLAGLAKEGREISLIDAVVAVKALVNAAQNAGVDTLKEKAQMALAGQSEAEILIPKAITDKIAASLPAAEAQAEPALDTSLPAPDAIKVKSEKPEVVAAKLAAELAKPVDVVKAEKAKPVGVASVLLAAEAAKAEAAAPAAPVVKKPEAVVDPLLSGAQKPAAESTQAAKAPVEDELSLVDLTRFKANPPREDKKKDDPSDRPSVQQNQNNQNNNAALAGNKTQNPLSDAAAVAAKAGAASAVAPVDAGLVAVDSASENVLAAPGLANAAKFAKALNAVNSQQQLGQSNAAQQVIVHIKSHAGKSSQLSIQLTPAELGKVELRLNIQRDGSTHVVVSVDKPETLALLQKDAASLEKALQQAGLNANQENMSFNLREQRDNKGGFSGRKRLGGEVEEVKAKELALNVHSDGKIISDNRVNYHA